AFFARLGIPLVHSLPGFLAALTLAHVHGVLPSDRIAAMSCSGGEASLVADTALSHRVRFPALEAPTRAALAEALGPRVHLANPLDYHTYVWGDAAAMARVYAAMLGGAQDLTHLVLDLPHDGRCDPSGWDCALEGLRVAVAETGARATVVASLPDCLPEPIAEALIADGIAPLAGIDEALAATAAMAEIGRAWAAPAPAPLLTAPEPGPLRLIDEAAAKAQLAAFGLPVPPNARAATPEEAATAAERLGFPVALKALGHAHKTEAGALRLGLQDPQAVMQAAAAMPAPGGYLVERMVEDVVAELILGITREAPYGFLLTIGVGGVLTELLQDSASLMVPATAEEIGDALRSLRIWRLLEGYRGKPAADTQAIVDAALALQAYAIAEADGLAEVEVNPLIATPTGAVAVDALIRRAGAQNA
ncbi:MAG: acetate--CoA ligase family protein, partial [Pseudomonadota bacterium]